MADCVTPIQQDLLAAEFCPLSAEEIEAGMKPYPHLWSDGSVGLFPKREVSVLAGLRRDGKTWITTSLASFGALGLPIHGMKVESPFTTIFVSAEDDRGQYANKIGALLNLLAPDQREVVRKRLIPVDLSREAFAGLVPLVTQGRNGPEDSGLARRLTETIRSMAGRFDAPLGLAIFETASTLSDADEDNKAFRILVRVLQAVARTLNIAVVLVHHVSQNGASKLSDLGLSTDDIRGGSALVSNSRQNLLCINLGSDDTFSTRDARTVLRSIVAPDCRDRITALVPAETSKLGDPAAIMFRWEPIGAGGAPTLMPQPPGIRGMTWNRVIELVKACRAAQKSKARDDVKVVARAENIKAVVQVVSDLVAQGKQPTATAVSNAADRSTTWAKDALESAVSDGVLVETKERVHRAKGLISVFRPK